MVTVVEGIDHFPRPAYFRSNINNMNAIGKVGTLIWFVMWSRNLCSKIAFHWANKVDLINI